MSKLIVSVHYGLLHDSGAAALVDYEVMAAVQLERLTRQKGDGGHPDPTIDETRRPAQVSVTRPLSTSGRCAPASSWRALAMVRGVTPDAVIAGIGAVVVGLVVAGAGGGAAGLRRSTRKSAHEMATAAPPTTNTSRGPRPARGDATGEIAADRNASRSNVRWQKPHCTTRGDSATASIGAPQFGHVSGCMGHTRYRDPRR